MLERSSKEVLTELIGLLTEYQNTVEEESRIKDERIGRLEAEIYRLKDKNAAIAHLLLED